jgi:hypothetical protein
METSVYCENHTKDINKLGGQSAAFLMFRQVIRVKMYSKGLRHLAEWCVLQYTLLK